MIKFDKDKILSFIKESVSTIIFVAVVVVFINTFIWTNAVVPSESMESTIMTGSRVIGFRLTYTFGEPERGDIVVFKFGKICPYCGFHIEGTDTEVCTICEKEMKHAKTLHYVKRLIGLPGDHIEIKGDPLSGATVYVNGEALDEPYINNSEMNYDKAYEFDVPEGEYFFLGDNRNDSVDSRYWDDAFIDRDKLESKVYFSYFPTFSYLG